jgi:phosphoribosylaminoimidazole carboxylase PurE protein
MGSKSDLPVVEQAIGVLEEFGVPFEAHVMSAHRSPRAVEEFAGGAAARGVGVIIAAAGGAAHLAGVIAANTSLPVIGLPIPTDRMGGMDSLLSTVQMPGGVPVACVGLGKSGAKNAAVLAVQILALSDKALAAALAEYGAGLADGVAAQDAELQDWLENR